MVILYHKPVQLQICTVNHDVILSGSEMRGRNLVATLYGMGTIASSVNKGRKIYS